MPRADATDIRRIALGRRQIDLQLDIIHAIVALLPQIRQHIRTILQLLHAEPLQRARQHDPRAHARREVLRGEGAQRDVLPGLDVARAPVVEEDEAEDGGGCGGADGDGCAEGGGGAEEAAELEFDV